MISRAPFFAVVALAALGCSTSHSLRRPVASYTADTPSSRPCTIGVSRFADEDGVDHAMDLRDYLRAHGPCARAILVAGPDDDADVVVGGDVRAKLQPSQRPVGQTLSSAALGIGVGLVAGGVIVLAANKEPQPDNRGLVYPPSRNSYNFMKGFGTGLVVAGSITTGPAIAGMVVDQTVTRDVALHATIDADVSIFAKGNLLDRFPLHDDATVRGSLPHDRPEGRTEWAASGPLYRDGLTRVYEHIAAHADAALARFPSGS